MIMLNVYTYIKNEKKKNLYMYRAKLLGNIIRY